MGLIKKPHELEVKPYIKALIYGQPGIGKSTLGLSGPRSLYIDCDNGVHRIAPQHQVDTIPVTKWEDVAAVLSENIEDYDTLVIDTAGKMISFMNEYLGRMNSKNRQPDGTLTQKGFGVRKLLFVDFLNKVSLLKKHIVFVAHDREEKKGDMMFVRPDIGGSSGQDMIRELDLVGYMEAAGNARTISFDPTEGHYGKNTCGLQSIIELPNINKEKNNLLTNVFEDFQKGAAARQEMGVKYKAIVSDFETKISKVATEKEVNEMYASIDTQEGHIWDSAYIQKMLVVNKAKEIGLVANRETKKFEKTSKAA